MPRGPRASGLPPTLRRSNLPLEREKWCESDHFL
jgi:hypothetical protein